MSGKYDYYEPISIDKDFQTTISTQWFLIIIVLVVVLLFSCCCISSILVKDRICNTLNNVVCKKEES